jgi:hypothetical protein
MNLRERHVRLATERRLAFQFVLILRLQRAQQSGELAA